MPVTCIVTYLCLLHRYFCVIVSSRKYNVTKAKRTLNIKVLLQSPHVPYGCCHFGDHPRETGSLYSLALEHNPLKVNRGNCPPSVCGIGLGRSRAGNGPFLQAGENLQAEAPAIFSHRHFPLFWLSRLPVCGPRGPRFRPASSTPAFANTKSRASERPGLWTQKYVEFEESSFLKNTLSWIHTY